MSGGGGGRVRVEGLCCGGLNTSRPLGVSGFEDLRA